MDDRVGARWEYSNWYHSDAGSRFVSLALTVERGLAGNAGSMSTVGDDLGSDVCESTIGLSKPRSASRWRLRAPLCMVTGVASRTRLTIVARNVAGERFDG